MKNRKKSIFLALATIVSTSTLSISSADAWVDSNIAAASFGGSSNEEPLSIAVDSNGNIFTSGYFNGTVDFDPSAGVTNHASAGSLDAFVTKLDPFGNLLWARRIGSTGGDVAKSIALDPVGNIVVAGDFSGTVDFDPGEGVLNLTSSGEGDVFVLKLDSSGNLLWAKTFGGARADSGIFISVDLNGNSSVTGIFSETVDFDPGAGTTSLVSAGGWDIYVSKFDTSGNLLWSKRRGSTSNDIGDSVAFDRAGNIYSSGVFSGTVDFDPSEATANLTSSGGNDMFISKFDASGNYLWAKKFGGTSSDGPTPITLDTLGNIYASGDFSGTVDFDPGDAVANLTAAGVKDNFILKMDSSGNYLWSKKIGSSSNTTSGARTAVDSSGNVFYSGDFSGTVDFDPSDGVTTLASGGSNDISVSKFDSSGNFVWAKRFGSTGADRGQAIAVDSAGNVYSTGYFSEIVDFDPSEGLSNSTSAGGKDIFISKLSPSGSALVTSMAKILTPADIAAAAAAAVAQARAAEVARAVEQAATRTEILTSFQAAQTVSAQTFIKAGISGVTETNIAEVNAEILAFPAELQGDVKQILKIARKFEVVGTIASEQVSSVFPSALVEIGLIPATSPNKTVLTMIIKKLPQKDRESFVAIKAAIDAANASFNVRAERLAKLRVARSS